VISLALVTWNRGAIVAESLCSVLPCPLVTEVVWVDQNSEDLEVRLIDETFDLFPRVLVTRCSLPQNLGAGWGLNRAFALARNPLVLVTDGDVRLGAGDVDRMAEILNAKPERLAVAVYPREPSTVPERYRGPMFAETIQGPNLDGRGAERVALARGLPMLCNLFKRELLGVAGWMREDFGQCEWNDNEWAERAMHHASSSGYDLLAFADRSCVHIPDEDKSREPAAYWDMKVREFEDRTKPARILELAQQGYPPFRPFP